MANSRALLRRCALYIYISHMRHAARLSIRLLLAYSRRHYSPRHFAMFSYRSMTHRIPQGSRRAPRASLSEQRSITASAPPVVISRAIKRREVIAV